MPMWLPLAVAVVTEEVVGLDTTLDTNKVEEVGGLNKLDVLEVECVELINCDPTEGSDGNKIALILVGAHDLLSNDLSGFSFSSLSLGNCA